MWTPKRITVRNLSLRRTRVFPFPAARPLDCACAPSDSRWLLLRGVHAVALPFPEALGDATGCRIPYKVVVRHDDPGWAAGWALDAVELVVCAKRDGGDVLESATFPADHLADPAACTGAFDNPFGDARRRYARALYSAEETRRLLKLHARTSYTVQTVQHGGEEDSRGVDRVAGALRELKRLFRGADQARKLWGSIDVNGDGKLDADEQLALVRLALPDADAGVASAVVAMLDADGDGYVTEAELQEALGAAKQRLAVAKERGKREAGGAGQLGVETLAALKRALADGTLDESAFATASRGGDGLCRVHEVVGMHTGRGVLSKRRR